MSERRHPIETLNIRIDNIFIGENKNSNTYICILWVEDSIGWGEYNFFFKPKKENGVWTVDSEYMDYGDDRDFGRALWKRLLKYKESELEEYKVIITKEEENLLLRLVNEATGRYDKELNEELLMKFMDNIKAVY